MEMGSRAHAVHEGEPDLAVISQPSACPQQGDIPCPYNQSFGPSIGPTLHWPLVDLTAGGEPTGKWAHVAISHLPASPNPGLAPGWGHGTRYQSGRRKHSTPYQGHNGPWQHSSCYHSSTNTGAVKAGGWGVCNNPMQNLKRGHGFKSVQK